MFRIGRHHAQVAYPRLVHGDGPLSQSSRGGRGVDKPNGRFIERTPFPPNPGSYESARPRQMKRAMFRSEQAPAPVAYPRLVHGDVPLSQSSRGGRGVDKPNGRPIEDATFRRTRGRTNPHDAANEKGDVRFEQAPAPVAHPRLVHGDGPRSQSRSRLGEGWISRTDALIEKGAVPFLVTVARLTLPPDQRTS